MHFAIRATHFCDERAFPSRFDRGDSLETPVVVQEFTNLRSSCSPFVTSYFLSYLLADVLSRLRVLVGCVLS